MTEMTHRYNLPEIEEGYTYFFQKALENKEDHLPYYEIQPRSEERRVGKECSS